ncbi:VOC family protein [Anaerosporobacter sp.]|uniref:VOC family protein n=1 Tax=Anaerosporobacter sp. TaxID=1872529 RepID=UPI00286F661F|nr:VOC family protein [Anaerosporobacter sp.]
MKCRIESLYLCVKDMGRAIRFYEEFFEQQVAEKDEVYTVFEIQGFRLGLFAFEKRNESHVYGSNCLPSISVESLEVLKNKIDGLEICFPLTQIGSNWVAEFVDSEGNHVEITTSI